MRTKRLVATVCVFSGKMELDAESQERQPKIDAPWLRSRIVTGIDGEFLHPGPESCTVDTYARGGSIGATDSPF
jgi:hypothetical protein